MVLEPRGENDDHICAALEIEDDEVWHRQAVISAYWLDEMIRMLQKAKAYCKTQTPDMIDVHGTARKRQYGWRFKKKGAK